MLKRLLQLVLLMAIPVYAQTTYTYPALSTNNVFTGTNTFNGAVTFGSSVSGLNYGTFPAMTGVCTITSSGVISCPGFATISALSSETARAQAAESAAQTTANAALPANGCTSSIGGNLECPGTVAAGTTSAGLYTGLPGNPARVTGGAGAITDFAVPSNAGGLSISRFSVQENGTVSTKNNTLDDGSGNVNIDGALNGTNAFFSGTVAATTTVVSLPGSDSTGATDNSTIVNAAIAAQVPTYLSTGACLVIPAGQYYVPSLSNTYGVCFTGLGRLLKSVTQSSTNGLGSTVTATKALLTSPSEWCPIGRNICGQEYAEAWFEAAEANFPNWAAQIPVRFTGDSTTAGNNTTGIFAPSSLFLYSASSAGIAGVVTTNAGVSGETSGYWLSNLLATDIAANPTVYVIRWGINDSSGGPSGSPAPINPAQTVANIRTGLATIRASKTMGQMTCVLETMNSTNDNPNLRAPQTYEQLRNGFVQAAHDYQCVFIDLYGAMPDTDYPSTINTTWMDSPYTGVGTSTPIIHVHPGNAKTPLYNDLLVEALLKPLVGVQSANEIWNIPYGQTSTVTATTPPSSFGQEMVIYRATVANGWPYEGMVTTFMAADGIWYQKNTSYNNAATQTAERASNGSSAWASWIYPGSTNPAISGSNPTFSITNTAGSHGNEISYFGTSPGLNILTYNYVPATGVIPNTAQSAAYAAEIGGTASSKYIVATSPTINTAPVEHQQVTPAGDTYIPVATNGLVLKDTVSGTCYRLQITSGAVALTSLTCPAL